MELNNIQTFGSCSSHNILKAMNSHWDILSDEERLDFLKPCKGGSIGYMLAGGQYWCDLLGGFTTADQIRKEYPKLFQTSYLCFNNLMGDYSFYQLKNGMQFRNINQYLNYINKIKNQRKNQSAIIDEDLIP